MKVYILVLLFAWLASCSPENKSTISLYFANDGQVMMLINGKKLLASKSSTKEILHGLKHNDYRMTVDIFIEDNVLLTSKSVLDCIDLVSEAGFVRVRFMDERSRSSIGHYEIERETDIDRKFHMYEYSCRSSTQVSKHSEPVNWDGIQVLPIAITDSGAFLNGEKINEKELSIVLGKNRESKVPTVVFCAASDNSLAKDWISLMKRTNDMSTATFPTKFVCGHQEVQK